MGEVYLARDTELKREVAIKALPDSVAQDAERVKRFEREARVLASINHPNIGSIFGLERRDENLFLILELVPGETLGERLDARSMSLRDILTVFKQIAQALEAAHAQAIVHRDLKPDNVKITPEGLVKVLDFGLAKPFITETPRNGSRTKTAPSHMTRDGHILGTPAYMSPEQARAEVVDKRTDIALVHNSDRGRELAWPRLPSSDHLAIRHPERRHGVQNLAPDPCLDSLCRQPSRSHR